MVILRTRNKITDFLMILAWASPFNSAVSHHYHDYLAIRAKGLKPSLFSIIKAKSILHFLNERKLKIILILRENISIFSRFHYKS